MPRRYSKNKRGGFLGLENLFGSSTNNNDEMNKNNGETIENSKINKESMIIESIEKIRKS